MVHIPIWLLVAGILVLAVPAVYFVYDAFCKPEDVNPGMPCMMITIRIVRMCPQSMMLAKMMIKRLL